MIRRLGRRAVAWDAIRLDPPVQPGPDQLIVPGRAGGKTVLAKANLRMLWVDPTFLAYAINRYAANPDARAELGTPTGYGTLFAGFATRDLVAPAERVAAEPTAAEPTAAEPTAAEPTAAESEPARRP